MSEVDAKWLTILEVAKMMNLSKNQVKYRLSKVDDEFKRLDEDGLWRVSPEILYQISNGSESVEDKPSEDAPVNVDNSELIELLRKIIADRDGEIAFLRQQLANKDILMMNLLPSKSSGADEVVDAEVKSEHRGLFGWFRK